MKKATRIAIIADFDENRPSHIATLDALKHASVVLSAEIETCWFPTEPFEKKGSLSALEQFDGIWGAPGIPESSPGFINAIQVAREKRIPYLGT